MDGTAKIQCSRKTWYPDRLRRYRFLIDGKEECKMRAGETISVPVEPGNHSVVAKLDWMRSNYIEVQSRPGSVEALECGSRIQGWRHLFIFVLAPYYYFVKPQKYLWLRSAQHEVLVAETQSSQGFGMIDKVRDRTVGGGAFS